MGTVVDYTVVGVTREQARLAVAAAHEEIERISDLLWEGSEAGEISALNSTCREHSVGEACRPIAVSDETAAFLERALSYEAETDGAFDVTVGSFLPFYDFGVDHPAAPDSQAVIRLAKQLESRNLGVDSLSVTGMLSGIRVSVGGIAKGYAVDRAVEVLREHRVENALINAGGDLYCLGTNFGRPWRVGIRDPDEPNRVTATVDVTDGAVATSGDYQQYFEVDGTRYHHLLDPETGFPARNSRSATVITTGSTERADALATGLFVIAKEGIELIDGFTEAEALLIDAAGRRYQTSGWSKYEVSE